MAGSVSSVNGGAALGRYEIALLKKQQDVQKQQGEAQVELIRQAARIAKQPPARIVPGRLDVVA
jgi:hypothetical protein